MNSRRFLHLLTMAASAVAVSPYWTPTPELLEPIAPPPVYSGVPVRAFDPESGLSMRFIRNFEAKGITRFDVLYGWSRLDAARVPLAEQFTVPMFWPRAGDVFTVKGINT